MANTPNTSTAGSYWAVDSAQRADARHACPRCASPLFRSRRRFSDRLLSLLVPVRRYICSAQEDDPACQWQGLLLARPDDTESTLRNVYSTKEPLAWIRRKVARAGRQVAGLGTGKARPEANNAMIGAFADISFEDMAQITLDAIGDAVLVVDPQGKVIYLNKVAERMTGWSSEAAIGRPVEDVFHIIDGTTRLRAASPSQRAIKEGRIVALALGSVLIRRDGTGIAIEDSAAPIHNNQGEVAGAVIVFHDSRLSQFEIQKMSHLALHDFLTSLPNRVLLMERLVHAIGMASRHHKQAALLFVDVDDFKSINDTFGHAVGDSLLQEVATEITTCVRATDTVSRHGGDEFIVLLTQIEDVHDAVQVADKLLSRLSLPRLIDGHKIQVSLSIGISVYPDNGSDAETLMRNADAAMYSVKESGRNGYRLFQEKAMLPASPAMEDQPPS